MKGSKGKMKNLLPVLAICICAAVLNNLLSFVVETTFSIPLYLDTVFTISVTFAYGLIPGMFTAAASTAILAAVRYTSFYDSLFVVCALATVLLVYFYSKNTHMDHEPASTNVINLLMLSVLLCFLVSITGGCIEFLIDRLQNRPVNIAPEHNLKSSLLRMGLPELAANIIARLPINIVDRPVSVIGGYFIAKLMPFRKI